MKVFWPKQLIFEEALKSVVEQPINKPFSEDVMLFTQALSKRFLKLRHLPEVVALGYWLRKANVTSMRNAFVKENGNGLVKARGTIFHIAPSNVDTIFVYSWMLSLMAGNRNVIRISTKSEINDMLQAILEELESHPTIAKQTLICTYEHTEDATSQISELCHTRVVWGGDQTIRTIRQIPLSPLANELVFADRFSVAVLDGTIVDQLEDKALNQLLEKFYNDAFWFNQMACSSPRLVFWVGKKSERFWVQLEQKIKQKNYELLAATQVIKYTTALQLATADYVEKIENKPYLSRVELDDILLEIRELHCGNGLFYEYESVNLNQIAKFITDKDQTMSYFGFTTAQLEEFLTYIDTRGLDRIVPIGQALDFDRVWDGQSFLTSFTRKVVLK